MKLPHLAGVLALAGVMSACTLTPGAPSAADPDGVVATRVAVQVAVDATLTALHPTRTPLPPLPTPTGPPYPWPTRDVPQPVTPTVEPRYPPPEPTVPPVPTPPPTPVRSPTPWPTPTSTPTPLPTRVYAPYAGPAFDLLFLRGGNLWLAEVGGEGERQLTFETGDWWVTDYIVSGEHVLYLAKRHIYSWGHGHVLRNLPVEVLGRRLDPRSGESVVILDDLGPGDTHLLASQDGYVDVLSEPLGVAWRVGVATGERTPLSRPEEAHTSPDGRYRASVPYQQEAGRWVALDLPLVIDLQTGKSRRVSIRGLPVAGEDSGWFHGWSPGGRYLLLAGRREEGTRRTVLYAVDLGSLEVRTLNPGRDPSLGWAVWAPDEEVIYATRCESASAYVLSPACSLVTVDPTSGEVAELPTPVPMAARHTGWACGGERLIFSQEHGPRFAEESHKEVVWAVRRDGSGLIPIVWGAERPGALDPEVCGGPGRAP